MCMSEKKCSLNQRDCEGRKRFTSEPLESPLFTPLRLSDKNRTEFFMRTFGKSPAGEWKYNTEKINK